jgi:hypothetical protein
MAAAASARARARAAARNGAPLRTPPLGAASGDRAPEAAGRRPPALGF